MFIKSFIHFNYPRMFTIISRYISDGAELNTPGNTNLTIEFSDQSYGHIVVCDISFCVKIRFILHYITSIDI